MKKNAFTLFESLIAALILTIVGSGLIATYAAESGLLMSVSHRLEAMNYARSCAEALKIPGIGSACRFYGSEYSGPAQFSPGEHNSSTDPKICELPDSYFKNKLNGRIGYFVDRLVMPASSDYINKRGIEGAGLIRVKITAEWDELFPKKASKKEILFISPAPYEQY